MACPGGDHVHASQARFPARFWARLRRADELTYYVQAIFSKP